MTRDMWHVTRDMWHVTHDMWHLTRDRNGEVNLLSKFQLPSSYGLGMKVCRRYFHKPSLSELISDGGDCRTAPATPGLLNIPITFNSLNFLYQLCNLKIFIVTGHLCFEQTNLIFSSWNHILRQTTERNKDLNRLIS